VKTYRRGAPEFHAAIGGIGTCGIVTEAELECVPAFNLKKSTQVVDREMAEGSIDLLLRQYHHLSFYYIGGVDIRNVLMNTWQHTQEPPSRLYRVLKVIQELMDMLFMGYLLGLARVLDFAQVFAKAGLFFLKLLMNGRSCVYPSQVGFSRSLYYHHDEIEYGIPYEKYKQCLQEILEMLKRRRFVTVIEVRFTPDASQATIAPGAGRRTCYINLVPSLSVDPAEVFAEAERIFLTYGGQVHLGKATRVTGEAMKKMYGLRWREFRRVQQQQDPEGKFVNDFVARILADHEARRPVRKAEDERTRIAS
jgi:FAD/FMN-containing dehydrogenase